jgi:hypothetical protein
MFLLNAATPCINFPTVDIIYEAYSELGFVINCYTNYGKNL